MSLAKDNDYLAVFYIVLLAAGALYLIAMYETYARRALEQQESSTTVKKAVANNAETIPLRGDQTTQAIQSIPVEDGFDPSLLTASYQQVQEISPALQSYSDYLFQWVFYVIGYHPNLLSLVTSSVVMLALGGASNILASGCKTDMPGLKLIRAVSPTKMPRAASPGVAFVNRSFQLKGLYGIKMTDHRGDRLSAQAIRKISPSLIEETIQGLHFLYPGLETSVMGREAVNRLHLLRYADVLRIYSLLLGPDTPLKLGGYLIELPTARLSQEATQLYEFLVFVIRSYSGNHPA